jgi:hypothetical protein
MQKSTKVVHEITAQSIDNALKYNDLSFKNWVDRVFKPINLAVGDKIKSSVENQIVSVSRASD